jgi:hypothetical protein
MNKNYTTQYLTHTLVSFDNVGVVYDGRGALPLQIPVLRLPKDGVPPSLDGGALVKVKINIIHGCINSLIYQ